MPKPIEGAERKKRGPAKGSPRVGGRKPGTPNKLTGEVKGMILAALEQAGGVAYLASQAVETPAAFLTLVGKVLPLQLTGDKDNPVAVQQITRTIVDPQRQER